MAKKQTLKGADLFEMIGQIWGLAQDLESYSQAVVDNRIDKIEDPLRLARDLAVSMHTLAMLQTRLLGHEERERLYAEQEAKLAKYKEAGLDV